MNLWYIDIIFNTLISKLENIDINLWYLDITLDRNLDLDIFNADLDTNLDTDLSIGNSISMSRYTSCNLDIKTLILKSWYQSWSKHWYQSCYLNVLVLILQSRHQDIDIWNPDANLDINLDINLTIDVSISMSWYRSHNLDIKTSIFYIYLYLPFSLDICFDTLKFISVSSRLFWYLYSFT